jgi:N-acetylmuramoyl-L-alanine amidase
MARFARRRTVVKLGVVVAVAGFAWVAAPALSTRPYQSEAVDFEQRMPAAERVGATAKSRAAAHGASAAHPGEGPVSFRSPPIQAPKRFDLVGLAGELRPLEIRTRDDGGTWSEWAEIAGGDPLYTGGSDQVQLRARGWRPRGTLHYVNVSGTATPAEAALTAARRAINTSFISVAALVEPAAEADPPRPDVIRRGAWGANRENGGCKPRTDPDYGKVKAAAIHHTVTTNSYSRSEAPSIVLGICRYHRNANKWNDIGYNALVDRFGRVYVGRAGGLAKPVVGAHAQGVNDQTTGVASIGTHTSPRISRAAMRGFIHIVAWKLALVNRDADGRSRLVSDGGPVSRYERGEVFWVRTVFPHRRVNTTSCPGDALRSRLHKMARRAQRRIERFPDKEPGGGGGTSPG